MVNTILLGVISSQGGWTVALVGYTIVFLALVCLILIFTALPKLLNLKANSASKKQNLAVSDNQSGLDVSGDVNAAISMALYMYFDEMHDDESNVITINRIKRRYSPWSSKIHNMSNIPVKK